jgi:Mg2+/citrate symporter
MSFEEEAGRGTLTHASRCAGNSGELSRQIMGLLVVTLANKGNGRLTRNGIATTANFFQTNNCGSSVAAKGSCTINVTFSPTAAGSFAGSLTVTDNNDDVANSKQTVILSGTGENSVMH